MGQVGEERRRLFPTHFSLFKDLHRGIADFLYIIKYSVVCIIRWLSRKAFIYAS
jgi:hypothetical protein